MSRTDNTRLACEDGNVQSGCAEKERKDEIGLDVQQKGAGRGEERRRNHQHRDGRRRRRRKGKKRKEIWWCTVLVHNISRSAANSFFAHPALSVPFTLADEPPNRLFFFLRGGEGRTRTRMSSRHHCRSPSVGRSRLNF
jgi:hypothetical protein